MVHAILGWLRKQKSYPWIGGVKETLAQVMFWGTIVNSLMVAGTFYYTTLRFIAAWLPFWAFVGFAVVVVAIAYVIEYKFIVPSIWAFRSKQMMGFDTQVLDKLDAIQNAVDGNHAPRCVVAVSGGFDPIHKGHVRHIKAAMQLGDRIVVMLSTDDVLRRKKGKPFMPYEERKEIIEAIIGKHGVVVPNDGGTTGIDCIEVMRLHRPNIYAKGGDTWDAENLPEYKTCQELGIRIVFGVGGYDKVQSSSTLIAGAR